jgi:tellurite resistance protein TerC
VHLGYGLAVILAFIGVKLILHWAHGSWKWLPEIPTPISLAFIVVTLTTVTLTSLRSGRRKAARAVLDGAGLTRP